MPIKNGLTPARIESLRLTAYAHNKQQIVDLTNSLSEENEQAILHELGSDVPSVQYVDGVLGKPLDRVNETGFTLTEFGFLQPIVDEAIRMLLEMSPVGPEKGGHYRDNHQMFVNGEQRDFVSSSVINLVATDVIVIVNQTPYARKVEGGFAHGSRARARRRPGLSVQAPDGVYEITANEMRRRFGALATISYVFRASESSEGAFPSIEISM